MAGANELTQIFEQFFKTIDSTLINNFKRIVNLKERQLKDYENFKEYCVKNPTKLFDVIDYIYPYIINNNNDVKSIIDKLKVDFNEDKLIKKFLNEYSNKILTLMNNDYIFGVVKQILKAFLLNILEYHKIYEESDKKKKIIFLIKKEHLHGKNKL